jgi:hypothetical protein
MTESPRCPICQSVTKPNLDFIYGCDVNYDNHYYHIDPLTGHECIREFTVGFDIWFNKEESKFSINIGNDPWIFIMSDKLSIMDLYHKIMKQKTFI